LANFLAIKTRIKTFCLWEAQSLAATRGAARQYGGVAASRKRISCGAAAPKMGVEVASLCSPQAFAAA